MDPRHPPAPAPPPVNWQAPTVDAGPAPGVRFAGYGARLVAYIVDGIVLSVVFLSFTIVFMAGAFAADSPGAAIGGGLLFFAALLVVSLAYFPWFWTRGGQTPGMKVFHIRVVRDADGGPISGTSAILRLVGFWVSSTVFYLGFIWIFLDQRRRGWHDLIAGTVVIEQP
jgi:uncharacterized RDD family membrane protein YckC